MSQRTVLVFLIFVFSHGGYLSAQHIAKFQNPEGEVDSTFDLHPVPTANSALNYRLLPPYLEQRSENAAVFYGKVTAEQLNFFGDQALQSAIADFPELSLEQVRESDIGPKACPDSIYFQLRQGALCSHCDWQIPIRTEPFFEILLPELQQTRVFARQLAARARFQIANGDLEEAIETLQTGYGLARHVVTGETYIHLLVAIAIQSIMDQQLECLIQQPDAPNMYWALAALPKPFLPLGYGVEAEANFIELSIPELAEINDPEKLEGFSEQFWQTSLAKMIGLTMIVNGPVEPDLVETESMRRAAELIEKKQKAAQKFLFVDGMDPRDVKQLSAAQSVCLAAIREFHYENEAMVKWMYVPYHQAIEGMSQEDNDEFKPDDDEKVVGLSETISPAVRQIMSAAVRSRRQQSLLMAIEAIRQFASENDGELAKALSDIKLTPVPLDPVTGKDFEYKLEEGKATITGPPLPARALNVGIVIVE